MSIASNLRKVRDLLEKYPKARLLPVTKNRTVREIEELWKLGIHRIGENRVQEMQMKRESLPPGIEKHLIGHLQSNKVKKAVSLFDVIQSVDSLKIAERINAECQQQNKILPIFLQVNISREKQKYGFSEEKILNMYSKIVQLSNIKVQGLMCIPKALIAEEETRKYFKKMKLLYTKIIQNSNIPEERFELSMGMSDDYAIALEEGATLIRVGRRIFEK